MARPGMSSTLTYPCPPHALHIGPFDGLNPRPPPSTPPKPETFTFERTSLTVSSRISSFAIFWWSPYMRFIADSRPRNLAARLSKSYRETKPGGTPMDM